MEGTTSRANNAGAVSGYPPAAAQRQEATPRTAESTYSAAPATDIATPVDAPHYPPHMMAQTSPVMQPATYPQGTFAQPPTWSSAPPANHYSVQLDQAAAGGRMPVVSIISPDDTKKIRKMQMVNFACSMLQLACAIVIIIVVREELALYNLVTVGRGTFVNYYCFAATPAWQGTCEYAYALASTSIFFCFILSLMQCLTMDCCGVGRAMEAVFDSVMFVWWTAGTVVLAVRADEANAAGFPKRDARNAVVALAAISAFMFLALLLTNIVLIMRLGKAYKGASQQLQQHMTAHLPAAVPLAAYPQQAPSAPATAMAPAPAGSNANQDAKNVDSVV